MPSWSSTLKGPDEPALARERKAALPDYFGHRAVQPRADAQQCDAVALLQPAHLAQLAQHDRHRGRADVAVLAEDGQDLLRVDAHGLDEGGGVHLADLVDDERSEEHTSELQSLMRISYAV